MKIPQELVDLLQNVCLDEKVQNNDNQPVVEQQLGMANIVTSNHDISLD